MVRPLGTKATATGLATLAAFAVAGSAIADSDHHHGPTARAADTSGKSTLDQRLVGPDPATSFSFLGLGPGENYLLREDIVKARPRRADRRRSLVYLAQLSDFQVSDEESPARVEFADRDPSGTATSAWRPQESLVAHQVEQTIRQVNEFLDSPVTQGDGARARLLNAVVTGDQADNQQLNETRVVLGLLEGGTIDPASGTQDLQHPLCPPDGALVRDFADPRRYTGVQDYTDMLVPDPYFYDPADVRGVYADRDWPAYPGLLDKAQEQFAADGLQVPSYVAFGNHDALAQGNQAANVGIDLIATGCVKPLASLGGEDAARDPQALLTRALAERDKFMIVPRDPARQLLGKVEYKELHRTERQGDAHGFGLVDPDEQEASAGGAGYYSFEPTDGVRYIVLDTVSEGGVTGDSSNGNIDDPQFAWLQEELEDAQRRDELILVFGHHSTGSLTANVPDETAPPCLAGEDPNPGCDRDPRASTPIHDGADLEALLLRFDNVIALVAGHSHENRVGLLGTKERGLWEIKSPAVVDWPTQHRLIEVMDNRDGTLSIFGTMLDHAAPATAPGASDAATFSFDQLGSLGRTLAYNDPQVGPGDVGENSGEPGDQEDAGATGPAGRRLDRNVELLLRDPRARAATDEDGATPEPSTPEEDSDPQVTGSGPGGDEEAGADPAVTAIGGAEGGSSLPFTGSDLLLVALAGLALVAAGTGLRRLRG